jgi:hypothetical protein
MLSPILSETRHPFLCYSYHMAMADTVCSASWLTTSTLGGKMDAVGMNSVA